MNPRLATAVVISALLISGCGGSSEEAEEKAAQARSEAGAQSNQQVQESVAAAPLTEYTMPNLLGEDLQSAQEAVKSLLEVPVWPLLQSHDVLQGWRLQVIDAQWQVCDQDPAPGATFTEETTIDFGVVKNSENCP